LYFNDTQILVKPFVKNLGVNLLTSVYSYFSGVFQQRELLTDR